jgi:hypothetical protein
MSKYNYIPLHEEDDSCCNDSCCDCCCTVTIIMSAILLVSLLILLLLTPWLFYQCTFAIDNIPPIVNNYMPSIITFSSCMGNWYPHTLMDNMDNEMHIFLGDNIYGDEYSYYFIDAMPTSLNSLRLPDHQLWYYQMMYNKLSCRDTFQRFMRRTKYVLSIWDDHDYGSDDEKSENPIKHVTKSMFVRFWKLNSERQNVSGIYGSYLFSKNNESLLIIVPDLLFDATQTRLFSEAQWSWLMGLVDQYYNVRKIVCFSHQISDYMTRYHSEIDVLFQRTSNKNTIFIAGDPHHPFIVYLPYGHIEITSSPLDQNKADTNEFQYCNATCSIPRGENNFGMINLTANTASIFGINGKLLTVDIFQ